VRADHSEVEAEVSARLKAREPLTTKSTDASIPIDRIERAILLVRGHKVMLDAELARMYRVGTKALNQAVKRNLARFPPDFMFQLTQEETDCLRSQTVTSKPGRGGMRYLPRRDAIERLAQRACRTGKH